MTSTIVNAALWWLQLPAAAETVQTTRIAVEQGWLATLAQIAQSFVSIALLAFLVTGVYVAITLKRSIERFAKVVQGSSGELKTIAEDVGAVAKDLRQLTARIKRDAGEVSDTVHLVRERSLVALDAVEERLRRFEALVDVVQKESEDIVVGALSTVRGIRAGASSLAGVFSRTTGSGSDDDVVDEDDEIDDVDDLEGDDEESDRDDAILSRLPAERPRIRPRRPERT